MSKTILSVEDSSFERKVIRNVVEDEGYELVEAENAEEGLEKYDDEKPDLVLLDIRLPDKDGIQVLKELHEEYNNPQVVMVSIVREEETIEEAKELGALEYVEKPVTEEKLLPVIQDVL